MEIAVLLNNNGDTSSLNEQGRIVVYKWILDRWTPMREMNYTPDNNLGMIKLRGKIGEIADFMGQCNVFVGSSVTGIPYFELEKRNCNIWEFQGKPEEFLNYILKKEEHEQKDNCNFANQANPSVVPRPMEIAEGRYCISIKEIQGKNTGWTSKQILQPFLQQEKFYSLDIICSHIPPWLENEMIAGNLYTETKQPDKNTFILTVYQKCCNDPK